MSGSTSVSVVVATFNQERYLADALGSVQRQTFQDWECIVVDDCSSDSTAAVAGSFVSSDRRFRYLKNGGNMGAAASRNRGNLLARGEYIASLDSDDWWDERKLELQVRELSGDSAAVLCATAALMAGPHGTRECAAPNHWLDGLPDAIYNANAICHSSVLAKRTCVQAAGGYRRGLGGTEDWDLWLRLFARFGSRALAYIRTPLCYYRIHEHNMSHNIARMTRGERAVVRAHWRIPGRPLCSLLRLRRGWLCQMERELDRAAAAGSRRAAILPAIAQAAAAPLSRERRYQLAAVILPTAIGEPGRTWFSSNHGLQATAVPIEDHAEAYR